MTAPPEYPADMLEDLLGVVGASLFDDTSPADMTRLEQLVCNDDRACELYVQAIFDSLVLRRWSNVDAQDVEIGEAQHVHMDYLGDLMPVAASNPVPGIHGTTLHGTVGYFSSSWPLAYLVATVILGVGILIGALVHVSQPVQVATSEKGTDPLCQNGPKGTPLHSPLSSLPSIVGRITGMVDCQWADPQTEAFNGAYVPLGRKYALASGLMEITYDTGAKVILQGPVTYEVESNDGGYLSAGKLTARIDKKEERRTKNEKLSASRSSFLVPHSYFAVRTPTATVTDLGTDFGVEVGQNGVTGTYVFVGEVQIATGDSQGDTGRQTRVVSAGQSAQVGHHGAISVGKEDSAEEDARRFARVMPAPQRLQASDAYAHLVLSMKPVVYYRMEEWPKDATKGGYILVDSASGANHGVFFTDQAYGGPSPKQYKFGRSLELHGPEASERVVVPDYPKTETGQLSASAWVWARTVNPGTTVIENWSVPWPGGEYVGQFALGLHNKCQLLAVVLQEDGQAVFLPEQEKELPRLQWQHVAFVADGSVLRLYRNGVEVGACAHHGICRQRPLTHLDIGCAVDVSGTKLRPLSPDAQNAWDGQVDEVAIFNHALNADQVRQLYTGTVDAMKP